ncbi:hypothetical protein [Adhaeribacter rhizoryzae]|uniref:Uncharacterized protein n=1 Tax=Adhaeribacter rhizoryzae TaxID=2607907 RepID=A0A5M6DPF1_9BACT|nr:hypothetical protein [Adhaeribacter rhizoryzae]KAA5548112.1 hypothetical protein F0145_05130 [Adhaeribacter rhizoryzae]
MQCGYTLEWLESLINNSLNLTKTELAPESIAPDQIRFLVSKIEEEKNRHQSFLNQQVFLLLEEEKIEVLINQYYASLVFLHHQARHNKGNLILKHPLLKEVHSALILSLEELTSFLEARFSNYLNPNQEASGIRLKAFKKEIKSFLATVWPTLEKKVGEKRLTDIIFVGLQTVLDNIKKENPISLLEVSYIMDLMMELKKLSEPSTTTCPVAGFNEILIKLNYNSQAYINYYILSITQEINAIVELAEKLEKLLFLRKNFNQINSKPGIILHVEGKNLITTISNWFNQEIKFLEKKNQLRLTSPKNEANNTKQLPQESLKIVSTLSVDQMSLILRAADELRVIKARSLNAVFKQIVPYLSTLSRENISFDSMRSKAYTVEEKDKEIVIKTLQQMVNKIKEY